MVKDNIIPNHMDIYWHGLYRTRERQTYYRGKRSCKGSPDRQSRSDAVILRNRSMAGQEFYERDLRTARSYLHLQHRTNDYCLHLF